MVDQPEIAPPATTAPSRRIRLACWGGIYLGACLLSCGIPSSLEELGTIAGAMPLIIPLFPFGLIYPLSNLVERVVSLPEGDGFSLGSCLFAILVIFGPYGLYALHLNLTWKATQRRNFYLLMIGLILIVYGNLAGCVDMWVEHNAHKLEELDKLSAGT